MSDPNMNNTLTWRLQAVMVDRGYKFAKDLREALESSGVEISLSSMSRLVYKKPKHIDLKLLCGLCRVLNCSPNDLLEKPTNSQR